MRWFYYLLPLIFHLILLPFFFVEFLQSNIALIEILASAIFIPIYLVIVSANSVNKISIVKFLMLLMTMLVISTFGILIEYFNWGISTGNFFTPDSETLLLIRYQIIISAFIIILGWIITYLTKNKFISP